MENEWTIPCSVPHANSNPCVGSKHLRVMHPIYFDCTDRVCDILQVHQSIGGWWLRSIDNQIGNDVLLIADQLVTFQVNMNRMPPTASFILENPFFSPVQNWAGIGNGWVVKASIDLPSSLSTLENEFTNVGDFFILDLAMRRDDWITVLDCRFASPGGSFGPPGGS